jgi:hypothetical protein
MNLTINIPANSIVIIRTYPALPPSPVPVTLPKDGMKGALYASGKQLGFVAKGNSAKVRLDCSTTFKVHESKKEGFIRFSADVVFHNEEKEKFLDKRWGTHGGIEQKGKKKGYSYNHEVHGYNENGTTAQNWRCVPVDNGFLLTCQCEPHLFLYFDNNGVACCGPRDKAEIFTFVPS